MRFSLRVQMIAVAVAAVVCAFLVYPDPIIGDLVYTASLLLIAFGTIAAIYYRGQRRAFLVGFLILYGGYYYMTVWQNELRLSMLYFQQVGSMRYGAPPGLITTRLLVSAYEGLHPASGFSRNQFGSRPVSPPTPDKIVGGDIAFMIIGHTVFAWILGFIGGRVAQRFAAPLVVRGAGRPLEKILEDMNLK